MKMQLAGESKNFFSLKSNDGDLLSGPVAKTALLMHRAQVRPQLRELDCVCVCVCVWLR